VANLTRGLTYVLTHTKWPDAYKGYTGRLIYYIGFNFWDVIPLSLIMTYHYQHFLYESSEDAEESVSETTTEESSSPSASS